MAAIKDLAIKLADDKRLTKKESASATEAGLLNADGSKNVEMLDKLLGDDSDFTITDMTKGNATGIPHTLESAETQLSNETRTPVSLVKASDIPGSIEITESVVRKAGRPKGIPQPTHSDRMNRKRANIVKRNQVIAKLQAENKEEQAEIDASEEFERNRKTKLANQTIQALNPSLMTAEQIQQLEMMLANAKAAQAIETEEHKAAESTEGSTESDDTADKETEAA